MGSMAVTVEIAGIGIALIVVILVLWRIARKSNGMGTIQGFGTKLYGNKPTPNGHIATKWIVFFLIPIIPVKSYEIHSEQYTQASVFGSTKEYTLKELPGLYWPQVGVFGVFAALFWAVILCALTTSVAERERTQQASKPLSGAAPDFTLVFYSGYDGGLGKPQISLSDLRGQVVLINFWHRWGTDYYFDLEGIWRRFRTQGVVFLGINLGDDDSTALQYLNQWSVTYPNGPDTGNGISARYHIRGIPESYLVDRQGKIIWFKAEPIDTVWLAAELDKALAE
jgi:cytochrome c biogenesis protein CcmG/thiol:disulfide interchange protein DsbE